MELMIPVFPAEAAMRSLGVGPRGVGNTDGRLMEMPSMPARLVDRAQPASSAMCAIVALPTPEPHPHGKTGSLAPSC